MKYDETGLTKDEYTTASPLNEPFDTFSQWFAMAQKEEINDPGAMSVASVDGSGMPNVRMVLLRRWDERGFCFFTNFQSQKGEELTTQNQIAACLHWKSLRKQVRLRGMVERVSDGEADEYFYSRPRGSQIASTASKQSRPLASREKLEQEVAVLSAKLGTGPVARPDHWSGFRIKPLSIEFWSDGNFRLHDRHRYDRDGLQVDEWSVSRLYP